MQLPLERTQTTLSELNLRRFHAAALLVNLLASCNAQSLTANQISHLGPKMLALPLNVERIAPTPTNSSQHNNAMSSLGCDENPADVNHIAKLPL
ncbi:hypothetical protein V8C35DRAFT_290370 [Trichoderma chlorosporum]